MRGLDSEQQVDRCVVRSKPLRHALQLEVDAERHAVHPGLPRHTAFADTRDHHARHEVLLVENVVAPERGVPPIAGRGVLQVQVGDGVARVRARTSIWQLL